MKNKTSILVVLLLVISSLFLFFLILKHPSSETPQISTWSSQSLQYPLTQLGWEKFQGTGGVVRKGGDTEENLLHRSQVGAGNYGSSASQRALFKNELLYFHFPSKAHAERAQLSLYVYTGEVKILVESIDNPDFHKELTFTSSDVNQRKTVFLSDLWVLNDQDSLYSVKIRTDKDLAILDYSFYIKEN